jgi:hypothetical protein
LKATVITVAAAIIAAAAAAAAVCSDHPTVTDQCENRRRLAADRKRRSQVSLGGRERKETNGRDWIDDPQQAALRGAAM